jgi:hypothetical protein
MRDKKEQEPSRLEILQEEWLNKLGKHSWVANLYQLGIGLAVTYLAIWWAQPYLTGWVISAALFLFFAGAFYGWFITRNIQIRITNSRAAIFSYSGLLRQFMPMLIILFSLRWTLRLLNQQGIMDTDPMLRTLTFFIAGVFMARSITILVMIFLTYKHHTAEV